MSDPLQGEVWLAALAAPINDRPVLVLTRSAAVPLLHNVTVATLTRRARGIATGVAVGPADGVREASVVSLDNILTIPKHYLDQRITSLSPQRMNEVWEALHFAFDMPY